MRRSITFILLILFLSVPLAVNAGTGNIEGFMEWRYGSHEAEEGGAKVFDADWLTQQYSLLYRYEGVWADGRAGRYNLALGYEWNSLDGSVNEESTDVNTGKFLYEGNLTFAPGGLPLVLNAYSRDLSQSRFSTAPVSGLFDGLPTDGYVAPGAVVGIFNGQNIQSGLTLLVGSASGDYEGPYREVLSNAPRLLFDYKQNYVRDLKGLAPQHYRDRNLAFVSLNKKDNWFHYRVYDHKDFLNENQDFTEKVYILGTIDQAMQRRWVQLTNWFELSVDGSYSTSNIQSGGGVAERRYDLNLFSIARRRGWEASNFTTYRRELDAQGLERELQVPFFVTRSINPETDLRFRFITEKNVEQFHSDSERDRESVFFSTRVDAFQRQRWTLSGQIEAETKSGTIGEGVAARALIELGSNRLYRPRYDFFSVYSLAYFQGEGRSGVATDFLEQQFNFRLERDFGPGFRTGLHQDFIYGTGELESTTSEFIHPRSSSGLTLSRNEEVIRDGDVFRSTTTWFGEYRATSRFSNRLELTYDYLSSGETEDSVLLATNRLRYDSRKFLASMNNRLILGEHQLGTTAITASDLTSGITGGADASIETRLYAAYFPARSLEANIRLEHNWRDFDSGDSHQYFIEQQVVYTFYANAGFGRRLFSLAEEIVWERFSSPSAGTRDARAFTLSGTFYPTVRTLLGARVRYRYLEPAETGAITTYLTAAVNFEKLQVSLDYAYGTREDGDVELERDEHRWELRARKVF